LIVSVQYIYIKKKLKNLWIGRYQLHFLDQIQNNSRFMMCCMLSLVTIGIPLRDKGSLPAVHPSCNHPLTPQQRCTGAFLDVDSFLVKHEAILFT